MTTTYTPSLSLPLQGLGDNSNAWGGILNTQAFSVLDDVIATIYPKSIAAGTTILGAGEPGQNESKKRAYVFTGALTGNSTVLWEQSVSRFFSVTNNTTGNFTLTLGANNGSGSAAGTTQVIPQGQTQRFYSDGTNIQIDGIPPAAVTPLFISGLGLSNDGVTPNTKIDVAAGAASDSTGASLMNLASAKVVDFTTNGALGLDTGAIAASTWYAIVLIGGASGISVMATKETAGAAISPTMPSGYTYYRYIGSVKTDASSHILPFYQYGQYFWWKFGQTDLNTSSPPITTTLITLSIPLGVIVIASVNFVYSSTHAFAQLSLNSGGEPGGTGPSLAAQVVCPVSGGNAIQIINIPSNTSGQIAYQASFSGDSVEMFTNGWIDPHVAPVF